MNLPPANVFRSKVTDRIHPSSSVVTQRGDSPVLVYLEAVDKKPDGLDLLKAGGLAISAPIAFTANSVGLN